MMKRCTVALALLAATAVTAHAQVKAGGEVLVNTYTAGNQWFPSVAIAPSGDYVVVWEDQNGEDGSLTGVFGQRFDRTGVARGAEFQVNTYTTGYQQYVGRIGVGADAQGRFVVAWASYQQTGGSWSVQAQRFDANGVKAGAEFQVSTTSSYPQGGYNQYNELALAMNARGNFVVSWIDYEGSSIAINAARFDAKGIKQGAEFTVSDPASTYNFTPELSMNASGQFVIAWSAYDANSFGTFARRYDAAGAPVGGAFQVNTYTTGPQGYFILLSPGVALADAGNFAVVWNSVGQDGSGFGVFGQTFSAAGTPVGGEFQVNTYTTGGQVFPSARGDANGNFVVTWQSNLQDGESYGVFAQRFTASGVRRGTEFQVPTYTTLFQGVSNVGVDTVGNFTIGWHGNADAAPNGISIQRYGGLLATALNVDTTGNLVFEPGETVNVRPTWRNVNGATQTFSATLANPTGPVGGVPTIVDGTGDYGTVTNGTSALCTDCYSVSVPNPATRPADHWDGAATESISPDAQGQQKTWLLHVGKSFTDVPNTNAFYRFIETLLHKGVTTGCAPGMFCPGQSVARDQMAVFVLEAKEGQGYAPPACGTPMFGDVPASSPFCRFVEELARRGVVVGCGGGNYCPSQPVTREQMAVFVLLTLDPTLNPPACGTPVFADVPASSPFCKWVEELARRGVVSGCGGGNYCPSQPVTREQAAVFIVATFGLTLYGP